MGEGWWKFWQGRQWREWWSRRGPWKEYKAARDGDETLIAPPRPISPAWVPFAAVFALVLMTEGEAETENSASDTTVPSASAVIVTTSTATISTRVSPTTSLPTTTTSLFLHSNLLLAPPMIGPSGDPAASPPAGSDPARVDTIVDGDTLTVILADGRREEVRLIGINSPESGECFADEAGLVLAALTPQGSPIALSADVTDRDQFDRLLRYIWVGGMSVNQELVRRGAAIARRYEPDTASATTLEAAQGSAQAAALGLWAPDACGPAANADIEVIDITYDAAGDDNTNLNGESVSLRNLGDNIVDLTGWGVKDESASHRYAFPAGFAIAPGETITIYSGCGDDFGASLFWCNVGSAVWNNDGDTAFVLDASGNTHHSRSYAGS